jgi:superfamily I DNA/RNA helicase
MANDHFRSLGARVEHLRVDEFQDVGQLEFDFFAGLDPEHIFAVFDDWQSIFKFKGAKVEIAKSLVGAEGIKTYQLTRNYRSDPAIVSFGDAIISQCASRIRKDVVPMREPQGRGDAVTIMSRRDLPHVLYDVVAPDRDGYRDWFILVRTNKDLYWIMDTLNRMNIPAMSFRREGMSLAEMKSAMAKNKVKVLTVHVSKGLEAKNVILYGRFPVIVPPYQIDEEERRVMYVGVTRAQDRLIVMN